MYNYILYRIGQFIALNTPLKIGYRLAIFFSDVHYLFAGKDRRSVTGNLKAIFPQKSGKEIAAIRIWMFRNFAKYLVDFFRFQNLDKEYIRSNIKIENIDYFDQALKKGKGVIILTAHLGNWELGGVVIALLGYPLWAVVLPHRHQQVNKFFNFQRESKGIGIIELGKAVRLSLNVLKQNKALALVGDRDFTETGIALDFFGKPTLFPEGPAAFALKTGAAIVPGFMFRNRDDTFTLKIEKPLEFVATGDKIQDETQIILKYKGIFEDYIKRFPDQWYMFRQFWIQEKK